VENAVFNDNNGAWSKMINQAVFGGSAQAAQAQAQQAAQQVLDRG
jgi:multiple sugar transport system substrate-binding protein